VADLREMLERLVAESHCEAGPLLATALEAQELLRRTGFGTRPGRPPVRMREDLRHLHASQAPQWQDYRARRPLSEPGPAA